MLDRLPVCFADKRGRPDLGDSFFRRIRREAGAGRRPSGRGGCLSVRRPLAALGRNVGAYGSTGWTAALWRPDGSAGGRHVRGQPSVGAAEPSKPTGEGAGFHSARRRGGSGRLRLRSPDPACAWCWTASVRSGRVSVRPASAGRSGVKRRGLRIDGLDGCALASGRIRWRSARSRPAVRRSCRALEARSARGRGFIPLVGGAVPVGCGCVRRIRREDGAGRRPSGRGGCLSVRRPLAALGRKKSFCRFCVRTGRH